MGGADEPALELKGLEPALVEAVERGKPFEPGSADLGPSEGIRAEVLRAILLGTPVTGPGAEPSEARPVRLTRFGIRIEAPARMGELVSLLRVTGPLDLKGIASIEGGFLPPLHFVGCSFDTPMLMAGARIESLDLHHCRFSKLDADGAHFGGSVILKGCGPTDPRSVGDYGAAEFYGWPDPDPPGLEADGPKGDFEPRPSGLSGRRSSGKIDLAKHSPAACQVSLRGASIEVGLLIEQCSLRAPSIVPENGARSMRYFNALELSHAHVRDRVELVRSTFVGGARFVGIAVGDDVWIYGGKFLAYANRYALDFQFARIVGQLGIKGYTRRIDGKTKHPNEFLPVLVIGQLSAIGLSAGEVWLAGGIFHGVDKDRNSSAPTLNFSKANVAGTFKLGLYHPHYADIPQRRVDRLYLHGEVSLVAATIGKNFEIHGASAGDARKLLHLGSGYDVFFSEVPERLSAKAYFKLSGEALKVDRRVNFTNARFSARPVGEKETGSASGSSSGLSSAIDLFKATIGTGLKIKATCSCEGALRLNSCVIGREAIIGCERIDPPNGFAPEKGRIPWLLDLRESTINGNLKIGRHTEPASPSSAARKGRGATVSDSPAVRIAGGITLEGAKVQGGASLRCLELDPADIWPEPRPANGEGNTPEKPSDADERSRERDRVALNMRDFVCGSGLEMRRLRWALPPVSDDELEEARKQPYLDIERFWHATVDLRGLRCGLLSDDSGDGWGLHYGLRLRLANFHVDEVEAGRDESVERRLRWLTFQNRVQRVPDQATGAQAAAASRSKAQPESKRGAGTSEPPIRRLSPVLSHRHTAERIRSEERRACSRDDDFVRHAYDVFATANARAGEDGAAEQIVIERKNVQAALRYSRALHRYRRISLQLRVRLVLAFLMIITLATFLFELDWSWPICWTAIAILFALWPWCLRLLQWIARKWFRYGFSPERALVVLAACITVGTVGVHYARYGGFWTVEHWSEKLKDGHLSPEVVLVLEAPYTPFPVDVVSEADMDDGSRHKVERLGKIDGKNGAATRQEAKLAFAEPSPCNLDVNSALYAADVFIPVLDLDQEERCGIRHYDPHTKSRFTGWRIAKALYELLGWIVTSLVILILSGVLRRDLERRVSSSAEEGLG